MKTSKSKERPVAAPGVWVTAGDGAAEWTETQDDGEMKSTRHVVATGWRMQRYDCHCCSCDDSGLMLRNDPACRMHGYAARRPCDIHNLPGVAWGSETEGTSLYGTMPEPVSVERARHATE